MNQITKNLCHLMDYDVERRLKNALGYQVESDEYPSFPASSSSIIELFDSIEYLIKPTAKSISVFDFGSGLGNALVMFYNAALAADYSQTKLIGIEKYVSLVSESKKYLNHCNIPENNYSFLIKDLKNELDGFFDKMFKVHVIESKFSQNIVYCNRLFRDYLPQLRLETKMVNSFPEGTIFIFYMGVFCNGKTEEDFKRLRIKQINNQVYIKLKDEEIL